MDSVDRIIELARDNGILMSGAASQSDNLNELATALAEAQGEFGSLYKGEQGYGYQYTSLAATIDAVRPILSKNGLSISQFFLEGGDKDLIKVKTMLLHSSGQFLSSVYSMPVPEMKSVNDSQRQGAAGSYARRYALQAILNLGTEDNDASSKGFEKPKSSSNFKKETKKPAAKKETITADKGSKPDFRRKKAAETSAPSGGL